MSYSQSRSRRLVASNTSAVSTTGAVWNKIEYDSPSINTAGFTESSDVFTCTIPGIYICELLWESTVGMVSNLAIYKNGVIEPTMVLAGTLHTTTQTNSIDRLVLWGIVSLEVGDTVSFYVYPASNATSGTNADNKLIMELIS